MKLNRTQIKTIVDVIYNDVMTQHNTNVALLKKQAVDKFKKLPIYKKIQEINDFLLQYYYSSKLIGDHVIETIALKYYNVELPKLNSGLIRVQIENKLILKTIGSDIDITSIIEQIKNELTNG